MEHLYNIIIMVKANFTLEVTLADTMKNQEKNMKKIVYCIMIAAVLAGMSCKSTPTSPKIEGEVTQDKVNTALEQIYDNYRGKLDMTGAKDYTVVRGDSLSQITRTNYSSLTDVGTAGAGNGFYFPILMLASESSHIVDPDLIEPGLVLKIPDLKRNLANATARKAIKDCLIDVAYVYNRKGKPAEEEGLKRLANSL